MQSKGVTVKEACEFEVESTQAQFDDSDQEEDDNDEVRSIASDEAVSGNNGSLLCETE